MLDLNTDPWTWPEKLEPDELLRLSEASDSGPCEPIFQYNAVRKVRQLRPAIEEGNGPAVMHAVSYCAMRGLAMPDWLAKEFLRRYRAVTRYQAKGWNAENSFGEVHPPGTHLEAERVRLVFGSCIHDSVERRKEQGESLSSACEALEIEMAMNPDKWKGWCPSAKTISRIYGAEEAFLNAWRESWGQDKFQKNSV